MYSREDDEALALATEFKETFSTDVNVDFVGVWQVTLVTRPMFSNAVR
jgi:hypothetical protein